MSRQIRVDSCPLIGSLVDFEMDEWMVEAVVSDPETIYRMRYWDTVELFPQSWLVTIRPPTAAEKAEWAETLQRWKEPPSKPWWRKVFG